jgi:hypothetical protein
MPSSLERSGYGLADSLDCVQVHTVTAVNSSVSWRMDSGTSPVSRVSRIWLARSPQNCPALSAGAGLAARPGAATTRHTSSDRQIFIVHSKEKGRAFFVGRPGLSLRLSLR